MDILSAHAEAHLLPIVIALRCLEKKVSHKDDLGRMTEILPPKTNEYPLNIIFLCLKMIPFPFEFCSLFWGAKFLHFQWGKVTKVPQREGETPTT